MNKQHLQEIISHYIELFPETNNPVHREYYKWQIIYDFRPMMDEALASSDADFPERLKAVKKLTANLIDNYTQPLSGLVEFSRKEPAAVRNMFTALFRASEADTAHKQSAIHAFLDQSHQLREKYFPDSYLYNDDLHSVTGYLFLYDPDHNYIYKASHCRSFADCVEFYDDWGSGESAKLDIFFRMCDETLAAIRANDALMATAASRYAYDPDHMHPDTEKHILLFDLIYCCSTYNLFKGIHYVVPKSSERQLIQAQKEKAAELRQALNEAQADVSRLNEAKKILSDTITAGKTVRHKVYGMGTVISTDGDRLTVRFDDSKVRELGISISVVNGLITIDQMKLSDEQLSLLKDEKKIRTAETYAEKALAPWLEYLE